MLFVSVEEGMPANCFEVEHTRDGHNVVDYFLASDVTDMQSWIKEIQKICWKKRELK